MEAPLKSRRSWRTPTVVLVCGGLALTLALGTRHNFGLYLQPVTTALEWDRQTFAFAIAIQNLLYGAFQPFTGMIADKFGAGRVLATGALIYAAGLVLMSQASTGTEFFLSAGLIIGIALGCCGFSVVYGAIARAYPPEKRSAALGIAGAAGSFGQFLMLPFGQTLINTIGWQNALLALAAVVLFIIPLSVAIAEEPVRHDGPRQSIPEALREALGHRDFLLLTTAFCVCGFQLMFISVHFPAYLQDHRMSANTGMIALALIGLFNILGSYTWGVLGGRYTKKYLLASLYFIRAMAIAAFVLLPLSPLTVYAFSAVIGFLWLGTVPLTNSIIAHMFGVRYMATLAGIAFFSHQVGSFFGVFLGGWLFDRTGSYQLMWWLTVGMGIVSALLNLPIDERPVERQRLAVPV
ncbi:MAG: MFS transporter [Burkholderiales bacterium]